VISSPELRCVSKIFFYFFTFFSFPSLHKLQGGEIRDKKQRKKIKILEVYQCFDNDTIGTIGKISMRRIQRHQGRSSIMTVVCPTSRSKANEPRHIWTTNVAHSGHRSWPFLVLLDLSHQYLSNDTGSCVIGVSIYLRGLFLSFLIFLSPLSLSVFFVNCFSLFLIF